MSTETLQSTSSSTVKNLVHVLRDGQEGFRQSSENVKNPELKALFSKYSLQRSQFAGELETELRTLGEEDPQKEGSTVAGAVHRGWIDLKAAISKQSDHAVLAEAERGEDVAKKAYKDALEKEDLSATVRQVISKQAVEIQMAHDKVKALRDSTKS
jgi:uncharacterized protein (TIGR02284 family)